MPNIATNHAIAYTNNIFYYSFKIFPRFWFPKSTLIIRHNQLKMTKFGRWRQKCSVTEKTWGEVEFFWLLKKNGGTFCGTFYSFHDDLMSKNIARRQLDGQNLLFGVYLQTWTALYLLNSHNRGELDIDEGKHVLACF